MNKLLDTFNIMATSDIKDDNIDIKKLFEEIKTAVTKCLNSMDLQKAKLDIFKRDIEDHPEKLYDLDGEVVQDFLKETIERCQSLSLKDTELINKLEAIQNLFHKTVQRRENGGRARQQDKKDSGYISGPLSIGVLSLSSESGERWETYKAVAGTTEPEGAAGYSNKGAENQIRCELQSTVSHDTFIEHLGEDIRFVEHHQPNRKKTVQRRRVASENVDVQGYHQEESCQDNALDKEKTADLVEEEKELD